MFSYAIDQATMDSFEPVVFNIFFWRVNDANGNSQDPLTETRALETVAALNQEFNSIKVFFKYRGMDEFNSPPDVLL